MYCTSCETNPSIKDLGVVKDLMYCQNTCLHEEGCHFISFALNSDHHCILYGSCTNPYKEPGCEPPDWWTTYSYTLPPTMGNTPIFHVSPAKCGGGWSNDPNGPFEFKGIHHHFYQYNANLTEKYSKIGWGHVAGNLSHWHCLSPAIKAGFDYNGMETPYDKYGVYTGSVTIVNGVPIATYPGEPGDRMCEASPVDLSDPLLAKWKKNPANPLMEYSHPGPKLPSPLGCTGAWREASGNWTTTIEIIDPVLHAKMSFWTSVNFINWTYIGNLSGLPSSFAQGMQLCSDFYPLTSSSGSGANSNTWVFGDNRGGAITGAFDRQSLTFTADRPQLASNHGAYAYDRGAFGYPKNYETSDGRRVIWAWVDFGVDSCRDPGNYTKNVTWRGLQTLPRVITAAAKDDPSTALLLNPVTELAALRQKSLVSVRNMALNATPIVFHSVQSRHFDIVVTFRGLEKALTGVPPPLQSLTLTAMGHDFSWHATRKGDGGGGGAGWIDGVVTNVASLSLRRAQDTLTMRVVFDGIIMESFYDGGRVRFTQCVGGTGSQPPQLSTGLTGITADLDVWQMGSAWLS